MNLNVFLFFFFCFNCQMFKGPSQDIDAIYTAPSSAVCGVSLETNGVEYLITGTPQYNLHIIKYKKILFLGTSSYQFSCHFAAFNALSLHYRQTGDGWDDARHTV